MKTSAAQATTMIAVATAASYVLVAVIGGGAHAAQAAYAGGFVPARFSGLAVPGALPAWITPVSATLLHGGLIHLGFNLLMLIYCGREDERVLGPGPLVALYLIGAYAAALCQFLVSPGSPVPMIGASGAISALVGAYAMLYGRRHASRLHPELARWLHIAWLAAAWVALQLLLGIASAAEGIAIAAGAHIGGFLAGVLLARPLLRWRYRRA